MIKRMTFRLLGIILTMLWTLTFGVIGSFIIFLMFLFVKRDDISKFYDWWSKPLDTFEWMLDYE